jgi:hypothetical protein
VERQAGCARKACMATMNGRRVVNSGGGGIYPKVVDFVLIISNTFWIFIPSIYITYVLVMMVRFPFFF